MVGPAAPAWSCRYRLKNEAPDARRQAPQGRSRRREPATAGERSPRPRRTRSERAVTHRDAVAAENRTLPSCFLVGEQEQADDDEGDAPHRAGNASRALIAAQLQPARAAGGEAQYGKRQMAGLDERLFLHFS